LLSLEIFIKISFMQIEFRRHRKSKHIRISIKPEGVVLVTYPFWSNRRVAEKFVKGKEVWIRKHLSIAKNNQSLLYKGGREDYLEKKEIARKIVQEKIDKFNEYYDFKIGRIAIRNQRSRWGSCSSKKNLNFNYRVVYLPEKLIDYLVVHELCHLKQMNHSKNFWSLVEEAIPSYRELSKKLRGL
jgi:predicted metal-dependent hydrolase|nr:M48 family metallopeptidase [Patescibacteria group bacterium]